MVFGFFYCCGGAFGGGGSAGHGVGKGDMVDPQRRKGAGGWGQRSSKSVSDMCLCLNGESWEE